MTSGRGLARDHLTAMNAEQARRLRAELRRDYGNKFSNINLNRMRQKQLLLADSPKKPPTGVAVGVAVAVGAAEARSGAGGAAAATASNRSGVATATRMPYSAPVPLYAATKDVTLRRIASSFAHVRDLNTGSCAALPPEDSEEDAREERAEVLICSQTMPLPPEPAKKLTFADDVVDPDESSVEVTPAKKLIIPDPLQMESRATERWQQLGSTVSALFRARRFIDRPETPMAQTRRLREQRELLEAFTRPFLYDAAKRQ
ncbi:hypothetical protein KR018_008917 [Drosophila ironensis]|nr:hypothetical protein KR018_008917 [Drosophila ironensis]